MSPQVKRKCDTCTECCNGWFFGEAHGKSFYPGKPCHFVSEKGCTIYSKRPHDPCVIFNCGWLENSEMFPEWTKPNLSKVMARKVKTPKGVDYYKIIECGQKIDSTILNYFIMYSLNNSVNISIQVNGGWNNFGSREFLNDIKS